MGNPWFDHLATFRKANPNLSMKQCMKAAKKTYKKVDTAKVSKPSAVKKTRKHRKSSKKHRKSPKKHSKSSKKHRKSSKKSKKH